MAGSTPHAAAHSALVQVLTTGQCACTPSITAVGTTPERITHLVEVAHRQCYIANSLATPVRIEPTITIAAELMGAPAAGSSGSR